MPETRLTFAEMPELMTPQQVESLLQISSSTFFRWAKAGQLPGAIKIGDSWRVVRDQLKDHFDQAAHTPNQPEGTGTMSIAQKCSDTLQNYMHKNNIEYLKAPEAGAILEELGILQDSKTRPGKPLRDHLRVGGIRGQEQPGGRSSTWYIRRID